MDLTDLNEERTILLQRIRRLEDEYQRVKDSLEERLLVSVAIVRFRKKLSAVQTQIIKLIQITNPKGACFACIHIITPGVYFLIFFENV